MSRLLRRLLCLIVRHRDVETWASAYASAGHCTRCGRTFDDCRIPL